MSKSHIRIFLTVEGIMVIGCVLVQKYEALGKAFFYSRKFVFKISCIIFM